MIYADLHIHIGQSLDGKAVKITASKSLTLPNILNVARDIKGLNLIGIVDAHSSGVQEDFKALLASGQLQPLAGGGYLAGGLTIIPGHEIELQIGGGSAHFLAYFPSLEQVKKYVRELKPTTKNWQLSTQKAYVSADTWLKAVQGAEGIWFPAHAFTPHKGIYGNCCRRLKDVLPMMPQALEIGLSADRAMAKSINELEAVVLFSNSDAHSLANIAREYNSLTGVEPSFGGLWDLLQKKPPNAVRNYGLPPQAGKYHRTYCLQCERVVLASPPQLSCPSCGSQHVVMGVLDRLLSIADKEAENHDPSGYVYQVSLQQLPGIGPKMYQRLLKSFGTEMTILHDVPPEDLLPIAGEKVTSWILKARGNELKFLSGGGGVFGRVVDILSPKEE
ncbi:endonuclease Q family protein [Desulfosporosinus sp. PR]|uniref:endonuclease Q family protein n=1 Tax=Candidatus Desulfosporosinus nitrosoreducens TaxID=3401928 RepID=UPI0027F56A94|nr:endonuclease Q family protein [Desulfosporosinus sp. PR]MDQ7095817.1 endonuclease Q family protein [Desulfosporosinus sp. PR]